MGEKKSQYITDLEGFSVYVCVCALFIIENIINCVSKQSRVL